MWHSVKQGFNHTLHVDQGPIQGVTHDIFSWVVTTSHVWLEKSFFGLRRGEWLQHMVITTLQGQN